MPLLARLSEEARTSNARTAPRRTLSLRVPAHSPGTTGVALVHDLSEHGLRIETDAALRVDEIIQVELPEAGPVHAKVVWAGESSAGCRFLAPVPKAAVSAALLRSPALNRAPANEWQPELQLIGVKHEQEQKQERERIDAYCDYEDHPKALTFIALLTSFVVSALFVLALFKMALPN